MFKNISSSLRVSLCVLLLSNTFFNLAFAQNTQGQASPKAQMRYVGSFEAGQPGVSIYKMYDQSDDVICYILMPENASRKQIDGKWTYEGNTVGSLSCLKARVSVNPSSSQTNK